MSTTATRERAEAPVQALEVAAYEVPTDEPESDGTLEWESTTMILVSAHAGGETGIGWTYGHEAAARVIESTLARTVAGRDALAPPAAWAAMQAAVRNAGRQGLCSMAIAAVDVALWELKARLLDLPLCDALPRFRESVPVYGSGGFTSYSEQRLREQLAGWVERGISRVKMKVGRNPDADPARVRAARDAIGPKVDLMADVNGAYTRKQALECAELFASHGVTWLEEPVSSDDLEGLRLVRDRAPAGMAIAAGEYGWDLPYYQRMLDAGGVDVLQADVTRCGGITELLRVDALCKARQLPSSAHCAPALHAHAGCAMETLVHLEHFHDHARLEAMLFDGALDPGGGELRPDRSRPGLGLELKRAEAARYEL
jgi:L-alanine-DL-glutamate epimerase-like enolase superfamily enzyme